MQGESDTDTGQKPHSWPGKVLLACDGSGQAAKAAGVVAAMASRRAVVRLLTVASLEYAPYQGEWGPLSDAERRQAELDLVMASAFAKPLEHLQKAGCTIERRSRLGNPAPEILREAEEWKPDLLVVGRTGAGGVTKLLVGSVSNYVIKNAGVPVLVVS